MDTYDSCSHGSPFASPRWYFPLYCLFILVCLVFLYRDFIFSDRLFNSYDMVNAGIAFRSYLVDHLKTYGEIPVWNPYILCGLPYVDAIHGDIFYPLSFLKYFLPVHRAIGWTFILHIFLAGIFAYAAARELRLSRVASGLVGAAYMFSGWLNSLVKPGHDSKFYVTALLPLLILFLHRAFRTRPALNYTMVGITLGCIILSPHPQMAYFCCWVVAGYTLFNIFSHLPAERKIRYAVRHGGLMVYAIVLAMMLGAIQFLPAYQYTRNFSPRVIFQGYYAFAISWSLHEEEAVSLLVPEFAGADIGQPGTNYWGRNYMKDNSEYAGLIAMLLALLGIAYCRRRDAILFAAAAAISLIYALGDTTPAFRYFYKFVPFVRLTRAPSMIMFVFSFTVSILAGMGVEALVRRHHEASTRHYGLLKLLAFAAPLFFLAGWYLFTHAGEETLTLYARLVYPDLLENPGKLDAARVNLAAIRSGFLTAFLLSSVFSVTILLTRWRRPGLVVAFMLPLLVVADGVRFNRRFVQMQEVSKELATTPLIQFLQDNLGNYRAFGHGLDELRLQLFHHGIQSPRGYHGNEPVWYFRLINSDKGIPANCINPRFSRLVGAKYILTPADMDLTTFGYDEGDIAKEGEFDGVAVVKNLGCYSRARLVGRYRVVADLDSVCRLIYDGDDDLSRIVYLDRDPGGTIDSVIAPGDTAEIVYYSSDSISIMARCAGPKILTLSDNYFRDWHVYVDGQEKEVLRTYGTFRGVELDPGEHSVVWKYQASIYAAGRKITLAGVIVIVIVLTAGLLKKGSGKRSIRRI